MLTSFLSLFLFVFSVQASSEWMDDNLLRHTNESKLLPTFNPNQSGEKLSQIKITQGEDEFSFRARSYNLNSQGEPVIMLHGFPSSSIMWERTAKKLSQNGYKVLAYDQRGYSPGARPLDQSKYNVTDLVSDLFSIASLSKFESFHLVGHDVGCVVSWVAAVLFPDRIKSLTCLSVSHPKTLANKIRFFPPPYLVLFGTPSPLAENVLRRKGYSILQGQYSNFRNIEVSEYKKIFTEPGALTAAINFYRQIWNSLDRIEPFINKPIIVPTNFIYGVGEQWVSEKTLRNQRKLISSNLYEVHEVKDAGETGHFVVENQNALVNELILSFLELN